jgi:hypothetical protein
MIPTNAFLLDAPDPLSLDVNLVGDGTYSKDTPCGPIVLHFLKKNIFATQDLLIIGYRGRQGG